MYRITSTLNALLMQKMSAASISRDHIAANGGVFHEGWG
jgi:hypothetical protein